MFTNMFRTSSVTLCDTKHRSLCVIHTAADKISTDGALHGPSMIAKPLVTWPLGGVPSI